VRGGSSRGFSFSRRNFLLEPLIRVVIINYNYDGLGVHLKCTASWGGSERLAWKVANQGEDVRMFTPFLAQSMPGEELLPIIVILVVLGTSLGLAACVLACIGKRRVGFRLAATTLAIGVLLLWVDVRLNDYNLKQLSGMITDHPFVMLILSGLPPTVLGLVAMILLALTFRRFREHPL
jgi:hypothetical protein